MAWGRGALAAALWLLAGRAAAHNGHTHTYDPTAGVCYGSIVGGAFESGGARALYGDWLGGVVNRVDTGTFEVERLATDVRPVAFSHDEIAAETLVMHQGEAGVLYTVFPEGCDAGACRRRELEPPAECPAGIRARHRGGALWVLDGMSGNVCVLSDGAWSVRARLGDMLEHSFLWPADYVAFASFDLVDDDVMLVYYNAGPEGAVRMQLARVRLSDGSASLAFAGGIEAADASHAGGDVAYLGDGRALLSVGELGHERVQSIDTMEGKLLDVDVETLGVTVCSIGLRHPWRIAHAHGRLMVADVGDHFMESLFVLPIERACGRNFGYPLYEVRSPRPGARSLVAEPGPRARAQGYLPKPPRERWNDAFEREWPAVEHLHNCKTPGRTVDRARTAFSAVFWSVAGLTVVILTAARLVRPDWQLGVRLVHLLGAGLWLHGCLAHGWRTAWASGGGGVHASLMLNPMYARYHYHVSGSSRHVWDEFLWNRSGFRIAGFPMGLRASVAVQAAWLMVLLILTAVADAVCIIFPIALPMPTLLSITFVLVYQVGFIPLFRWSDGPVPFGAGEGLAIACIGLGVRALAAALFWLPAPARAEAADYAPLCHGEWTSKRALRHGRPRRRGTLDL